MPCLGVTQTHDKACLPDRQIHLINDVCFYDFWFQPVSMSLLVLGYFCKCISALCCLLIDLIYHQSVSLIFFNVHSSIRREAVGIHYLSACNFKSYILQF